MGILERLRGIRDRRKDTKCPLNVADERARRLYGPGPKISIMFTRDPNHPVCRKCTRRNWFNCGVNTTPIQTRKVVKKEEKPKDEHESLEGFRKLFYHH